MNSFTQSVANWHQLHDSYPASISAPTCTTTDCTSPRQLTRRPAHLHLHLQQANIGPPAISLATGRIPRATHPSFIPSLHGLRGKPVAYAVRPKSPDLGSPLPSYFPTWETRVRELGSRDHGDGICLGTGCAFLKGRCLDCPLVLTRSAMYPVPTIESSSVDLSGSSRCPTVSLTPRPPRTAWGHTPPLKPA